MRMKGLKGRELVQRAEQGGAENPLRAAERAAL